MVYSSLGPHVLVLEYSTTIREMLVNLFASDGYRVSAPIPGPTTLAIQALVADLPDVMILDVPYYDHDRCWRLLASMRITLATAAIPVFLLTTESSLAPNPLGAPVICKPFAIQSLAERVAAAVGAPSDPWQPLTWSHAPIGQPDPLSQTFRVVPNPRKVYHLAPTPDIRAVSAPADSGAGDHFRSRTIYDAARDAEVSDRDGPLSPLDISG